MLHNNSIQYYYLVHTIRIKKHTQEITTSPVEALDIQILLFKIIFFFFIYTHHFIF